MECNLRSHRFSSSLVSPVNVLMSFVIFILSVGSAMAETSFGVSTLQTQATVHHPWSLMTATVTVAIIFACLFALLLGALHYKHRAEN